MTIILKPFINLLSAAAHSRGAAAHIFSLSALYRHLKLILLAGFALTATGCSFVGEDEPEGVNLQVGDMLPKFEVIMDDGTLLSNESLRGSCGAIVFFHTDCEDCRRELPEIQRIYNTLTKESVKIVCIAREEEAEQISEWWRDNGITLPFSPQSNRRIYNLFATEGIPRLYIFNSDGRIISTEIQDLPKIISTKI